MEKSSKKEINEILDDIGNSILVKELFQEGLVGSDGNHYNIEDVKPRPITEKYLLDFGFKSRIESDFDYYDIDVDLGGVIMAFKILIPQSLGEWHDSFIWRFKPNNFELLKHLNYVHEVC